MVTSELLDFLRAQLATGMSYEEVERLLVEEGGWDKADVEEGLAKIGATAPTPKVDSSVVVTKEELAPAPVEATLTTAPVAIETKVDASTSLPVETAHAEVSETVTSIEEPKTLNVLRNAHVQKEEVEDFLGIFANHQPAEEIKEEVKEETVVPVSETPVVAPLESAAPAPVVIESHENDRDIVPLIKKTPEVESLIHVEPQQVQITPEPVSSPDANNLMEMLSPVAPEIATVVPESNPVITEAPKAEEPAPVNTEVKTQVFKFDLSKIKNEVTTIPTTTSTPPALPPSEPVTASIVTPITQSSDVVQASIPAVVAEISPTPASPPIIAKPVETRSVAELWLTQGKVEAQPAKDEAKEKTLRASLSSRRTMTSDILLRGKGAVIQGLPSLLPAEEANPMPTYTSKPIELAKPAPQKVVVAKPTLSPAEQLARKNKIKKTLKIAGGVLGGIALVAAGAATYLGTRGPDANTLLASALPQFVAETSFSYSGSATSDVVLTSTSEGVTRNGAVKFALGYAGQLNSDKNGYGNGSHHVKWSGGLQSGNFAWGSDIETDLRMVGQNLYFHILSFPSVTDVDPDIFKTYWIKVDIGEIAKELSLDAVSTSEEYSGIAGGETTSFISIMKKNLPFTSADKLGIESINNVSATHLHLKTDPEKMYNLSVDLYKKYTGKTLALTQDEKLGLVNALEKLSFEIWVDEKTNNILQIKVSGTLNNDVAGIHIAGPIALSFTFVGYGSPVGVTEPAPYLSLDEVHTRMDDYKKTKEVRAKNAVRINGLGEIQHALIGYQTYKGRFPTTLAELRANDILATTTISDVALKSYVYAPYVVGGDFTKANKCTVKSKTCATYHIGVSLDDATDPALTTDADQTSEIHGEDNAGCAAEREMQCYDIVFSLAPATSTASTSTPKAK